MALQRDPLTFRRLKALSMRKRLDVISSNEAGPGLFSMLTPTDLALLFPDYFKRVKPDVSGFRAAISKQSAEQQAAAQGSFLERLSAVEATAAGASLGAAGAAAYTKAGGAGVGTRPQAQLTTEQMAAWNKLQQGALDINSPEGKIFGKLSAAQLASLGISKSKSNVGADVYQYQQPQVTQEETLGRMQQPSGGSMKQVIDNAAKKYGVDPRIMYGIVAGESGAKTKGGYDVGDVGQGGSFGPFQLFVGGGEGNKFMQMHPGANLRSASSIPLQADYVAMRIAQIQKNKEKGGMIGYEVYRDESRGGPWHGFKGPRDWDPRWFKGGVYENIGGTSHLTVEPAGPGGQYTPDQINKMMEQIKTEKNDQRRQELANILVGTGVPTATVQGASLENVEGGGPEGRTYGSGQCVALSQRFSNLGPARDWKFHEGESGIVPGAVIATRTYGTNTYGGGHRGDPGGIMARNTVDKKSHYHTGIALTAPDGNGDVLVYDQYAGHGAAIRKWNIRDYHGEKWGAVVGGEPSEKSNEAIQLALSQANPAQREAILTASRGQSVTLGDHPKSEPVMEKPPAVGELPTTQEGAVIPPPSMAGEPPETPAPAPLVPSAEVMKQESLNPQAVQDINAQQAGVPPAPPPTATPIPKVTSGSYQLNMKAFREAVKNDPSNTYPGWMIDMASDQDIIDGFNKDARVKAAGVSIADGKLTVKDTSNPEVKAVIEGAQKSGALKAIEQPKPKTEPPKPAAQKPATEAPKPTPTAAPEPPKPTATVEQRTSRPGEAPEATPPAPPEPPKPVEGHSDGGSFAAPENINFYKVDKQDDIVAVNPQTQQPIATVQSGETLTRDGNRVDVTPQPKANDAGPVPDVTGNQLTNLVSTVSDALSNVGGAQSQQPIPRMAPDAPSSHPNLIDQTNKMIANQQKFSPSYDRAMHRISQGTEPPGSFNHFSYGNK